VGEGSAARIGRGRHHVAMRGIVQLVVHAGDHARGVAKRRMRRHVVDALAIGPDLATVADRLQVLVTREGAHG
jgi:hypothetical protein